MATHSSVLAWRIPRMGEPGGLLSKLSSKGIKKEPHEPCTDSTLLHFTQEPLCLTCMLFPLFLSTDSSPNHHGQVGL